MVFSARRFASPPIVTTARSISFLAASEESNLAFLLPPAVPLARQRIKEIAPANAGSARLWKTCFIGHLTLLVFDATRAAAFPLGKPSLHHRRESDFAGSLSKS